MATAKPLNNTSPKQEKGCFLQWWALILLIAVAAICVITVGLLVNYLTSCKLEEQPDELPEVQKVVRKPPYLRLPRSIVPEHYDVELQPYLIPDNFTFDGNVRILIRVLEATNNVTLHIYNVSVKAKSVKLAEIQSGTVLNILSTNEDEDKQFYILHLKSGLKPGSLYEIYMEYVGSLNDELEGFYRSSYKDADGKKRWVATTHFEPTFARRAFPCFDEPAMKATFNITLVHWTNMTSLSNMPIYKNETRGDGWVADYFEKSVRMSTYLLAFVVSDYSNVGTPEFSVWSRDVVLNTTSYALQIGPLILKFYEFFFNIKYPLPKTDMVAVPDVNGAAMENWGLITYNEIFLLYDKRYASSSNKEGVATAISHELAHQWFGNLVTPAWWDDIWLKEGFATYLQCLGVNAVHPEWKMEEQFVLDTVQVVMYWDSLIKSHAISLPVQNPDEISEVFDNISYRKGASIIRMMKFFLGNKNFRNGLTNFLNAKKFSNAVQDDLWHHLTAVQAKSGRIDVKTVMDSWTLQTGYPVVEVIRNYTSYTAQVNQHRFLQEKDENKHVNYQWEIPFTYTNGVYPDWTPNTKLWLHKTNGSIERLPSSRHWILANVQEVGFYKVNYDEQNWKLLIKQLMDDHTRIHTINRAQIIDDSLDLARAGQLNYHLALNTTRYLKKEEEYLPLKSAMNSFTFIDSMICRSTVYGKWKKYLIDLLKPKYETLGWEESPDETLLTQYMRIMTLEWMCRYGYEKCINRAYEMYQRWKEDPTNVEIIPPNLRDVVFTTAVKYGGQDVWNFLWAKYKATHSASEKYQFMCSLTYASEPWLLTRYLNWTLTPDSGISKFDGSYISGLIGKTDYGRDLTFNYVRANWDVIFKRYGNSTFEISGLFQSMTSSLNTQFELFQLIEFYNKHKKNLGKIGRVLEQSVEQTKANVRWMDNYYAQVVDWLETVELS